MATFSRWPPKNIRVTQKYAWSNHDIGVEMYLFNIASKYRSNIHHVELGLMKSGPWCVNGCLESDWIQTPTHPIKHFYN